MNAMPGPHSAEDTQLIKFRHPQKRLQPVAASFRNGLHPSKALHRGGGIRTPDLLRPRRLKAPIETC